MDDTTNVNPTEGRIEDPQPSGDRLDVSGDKSLTGDGGMAELDSKIALTRANKDNLPGEEIGKQLENLYKEKVALTNRAKELPADLPGEAVEQLRGLWGDKAVENYAACAAKLQQSFGSDREVFSRVAELVAGEIGEDAALELLLKLAKK